MAPAIAFGILGPLEASIDGTPVAVGGPRVRAILGVLLLAAGRDVSADSLIRTVWGEEAPHTARASLQMHISKIRKALAVQSGSATVTTRGSSYSLAVDTRDIDAGCFRALVSEGQALLAGADYATAAETLREALALWRGDPLEDLDLAEPDLSAIRQLHDLRESAEKSHLEALLALRRYAEAVPDALRARSERPLDERLATLAALALVGSGRQGEALAELEQLRHALSTELGMESGPAVLELERRILEGDTTLTPAIEEPDREMRELRKTVTVVALRLPAGDPEEVRAETRAMADLLGGAVSNLGGWCPPARSGRLLGIFGVPTVHEDDAERAVRTADALARAAAAMGMDARTALSTGEVLVETDGDSVRLLSHEPVEAADLLARKAKPGEVLLGVGTRRLVQAIATFDQSPVLLLDDEELPIAAYRLMGVAQGKAAGRLSAPLIGREHETERLRTIVHRSLTDNRPTLLALVGAAGVGKSRLLSEFVAGLGDRVDVAAAHCLSYERDVGVGPITRIVRAIAALPEDGSAAAVQKRLREFVGNARDGDFLLGQLGSLIGVGEASPSPDEMHWAIRRALEVAGLRQPLVVVLEDLQWADESLLDLVAYLTTSMAGVPVAVLCTARTELLERRPEWIASAEVEIIRIEPLSERESDDLLAHLLGPNRLSGRDTARIASAAEGNPLFLEETVSILIDDGHLKEREGKWVAASDLSTVPLPPTVRALLEARVDRLPLSERSVLEMVAIVGREFSDEDVEALRPEADAAFIGSALDALCRRDLLELHRMSRPGARQYTFRHILIRDVVYQSTPRDARARDHELLGRSLSARAGDRLSEVEEVVGYHLETAFRLRRGLSNDGGALKSLGEDAASHLSAAGRRAFGRDDLAAAASLFGRAIECLAPTATQIGELSRLRGAALFDLGRFDDAEEAIRRGLEAAKQQGDEALVWRLELEIVHAVTYLRPGERTASEVLDFAEQAVAALGSLDDLAGVARAERLKGEALSLLGRQEEALDAYIRGWRLAMDAGDERELALRPQPTGVHGPTRLDTVIEQCERLIAESSRPRPETLMRLSLALAFRDEAHGARENIDKGLRLAREVGGAFRVADSEVYAGAAFLYMGDARAAVLHLHQAVVGLRKIGESSVRSTAVALLGEGMLRIGDQSGALDAVEESRGLAAEDDLATQMAWRQVNAKILLARGELGAAREVIDEAVRIAESTDFLVMAAFVHLDAAEILMASGEWQRASGEESKAFSLLRRKGASEHLARYWNPRVAEASSQRPTA